MFGFLNAIERKRVVYAPKDDITTLELAEALKVFVASQGASHQFVLGIYEGLRPEAKRHFYLR